MEDNMSLIEFENEIDFDFNSLKTVELSVLSYLPPSIIMIITFFLFMIEFRKVKKTI